MTGLHVAIIMDGNGRWARLRGMPRWRGHLAGLDSVRDVVRTAPDLGIGTLTLYAFSSDNWKRSPAEVGRIFWLMRQYARIERQELIRSSVRVSMIGRKDRVPKSALREMELTEDTTASCSRLHLRLAIDYSSRSSILRGLRDLIARGTEVEIQTLDQVLNDGAPPPDLVIRTAGEQRLSDFLLWESAYAELYFTDRHWPDFRGPELAQALADFRTRDRRFGGLGDEDSGRKAG